ncbi:MAG: GTP 3',8-cyclase MoaA [Rhizobacter sp.]|nr:GTP 3',8-cyclase MoaA [Chlorobiales bacterium]
MLICHRHAKIHRKNLYRLDHIEPPPHWHDNHGRPITYLRLSITDRCNLRCRYCMPEHQTFLPADELLSFDELLRLARLLTAQGITKIRITGGEPFVRDGLMDFLWQLRTVRGLAEISITTNGTLTAKYIPELKRIGIASVNLSLDTLDLARFNRITGRDELNAVMQTLDALLSHGITTKINAVVMHGLNTEDIIPLAELARTAPVTVRFIEEMPFNGEGARSTLTWNHEKILSVLLAAYPNLMSLQSEISSTSMNFSIPEFQGSLGIIAAYSRTFCGTCNRLRLTAKGTLHTCLYEQGGLDLKWLLRSGVSDDALITVICESVGHRYKNGYEAEAHRQTPVSESMSVIGG